MRVFKKKRGRLLLPHKPGRLERMWSMLKWIRQWNRMGGEKLYVDPLPDAIDQYSRIRKEAERVYIRNNEALIKERRIGLREAVMLIWREGKGTI